MFMDGSDLFPSLPRRSFRFLDHPHDFFEILFTNSAGLHQMHEQRLR
jgi:hypothetical protein